MIEKHYFFLFFLHFYSEARPMVLNLCSPKTGAENLDIIGFHFISPTSHKWSRLSLGETIHRKSKEFPRILRRKKTDYTVFAK